MYGIDEQYLNLLKDILIFGEKKEDRTGTGTISLFSPGQMRFDLQEGFPLLALKYTSFKLAFGELMWMLSGSTSNKELEEKYGVNFWKHWQDEQGELPNVYGKQMARSEGERRVVKIRKKILPIDNPIEYPLFPLQEVENSEDSLIGKTFTSASSGEFIVLRSRPSKNQRRMYEIQFIKTGYTKVASQKVITLAKVKDPYFPSVTGKGFKGEYDIKTELDKKIYKMWRGMIYRCYGEYAIEAYKHKKVFVCNRWLNFSNFRKDVELLPNWHKKKYNFEGYELDKDYFGSNCYSPDTCAFLTKQENLLYQDYKAKPFIAVHPNGHKEVAISTADFARDNGLRKNSIQRLLKADNKKRKTQGFSFYYTNNEEGYVYRYQLPVNQILRVIDEIKENPNSRRLIIDNWSAYDLDHQALPACHAFVQFYVSKGRLLSCKMYQRSVDVMLGLPYNIAFYSLLTHMIAHVTGLEVGEFIHDGGDTHIYNNLMDMTEEVSQREPREMPKLKIKRKVDSIYDFKLEDFKLEGYNPYPTIKGSVSI